MIFFSGWHKIISILFGNSKIQKRNSCASLLGVTITKIASQITRSSIWHMLWQNKKFCSVSYIVSELNLLLIILYYLYYKKFSILELGSRRMLLLTYRITENLLVHWFAAIVFICVFGINCWFNEKFLVKKYFELFINCCRIFILVNFCPQNVGRCCCWWWCNIHFP